MVRKSLAVGAVLGALMLPAYADEAADAEAGAQIYAENCAQCHGEQLRNEGQAADLKQLGPNDRGRFEKTIQEGKGQMPPWRGVISDEQMAQIWAYVMVNSR